MALSLALAGQIDTLQGFHRLDQIGHLHHGRGDATGQCDALTGFIGLRQSIGTAQQFMQPRAFVNVAAIGQAMPPGDSSCRFESALRVLVFAVPNVASAPAILFHHRPRLHQRLALVGRMKGFIHHLAPRDLDKTGRHAKIETITPVR